MTIRNVVQKVGKEYYNNPFWETKKEAPLDYELELIHELMEADFADVTILTKALRYLGWDKLVDEFERLEDE